MPTVRVEEVVNVDREAVFSVLTDHARYNRFPGIAESELIRAGDTEPNGLGAVRRLRLAGPVVLEEAIVAYDAPNSFEYRITRVRPLPVKHTLGRVEFISVDANKTKIVWTSEFDILIPIVGGLIGKRLAGDFTRGFRATIHSAADLAHKHAA